MIQKDLFNTPGTSTWTCPAQVTGVLAIVWGPGGDGSSDHGGGGGASVAGWFDVEPGHDYDVVIADKTGDPSASYLAMPSWIHAPRGESASVSDPGLGGKVADSLGTTIRPGDDGDTFFTGAGGNSGAFYDNFFTGNGTGDGGLIPGQDGSFPGGGGASANGQGADGAVYLVTRTNPDGHGGGGGAGYARSTLSVTPGNDYDVYIGRGGWGQCGTIGVDPLQYAITYSAVVHGESSWFGSSSTVRAAGGDSVGTLFGDDDEALQPGALGGGQPGAQASNLGDFTTKGGNGGAGNGISRRFAGIGGGGGGAGGPLSDGGNGVDGKDGGRGGWGGSYMNYASPASGWRRSSGGNGVGGTGARPSATESPSPGGGSGGDSITFLYSLGYDGPTRGSDGQIRISGMRTGRLLVPGFWDV